MAFRPNYNRDRHERDRAARARSDEKQRKKDEKTAQRKAERAASAATILPCLPSECGFRRRRLCPPRLSGATGGVSFFLFVSRARFAAKFRPASAPRLAGLLRSCHVTGIAASASTVTGVAGFAPRQV